MSRKCEAICADESPCNAWAVRDSDPPRCAAHGGGEAPVGAPPGNRNAVKHGYYSSTATATENCTIDAVIGILYTRQKQLDRYLDDVWDNEIRIEELSYLLKIHGQNASRLGRLLRDRRALSGDASDGISGAIAQALDELSTELETEL